MSSVRDSYKKPSLDQQSEYKKPFKLEDGKNLFRLIPPLPALSADGKWFKFYAQHFGYKVLGRDDKEVLKTFVCPRVYNKVTKEEKVPCAECAKIEKQNTIFNQRKVKYQEEGLDEKTINARLEGLTAWLSAHNRSSRYYVQVMNGKNEFGYVPLPSGAFFELKERIAELERDGIDPWSPDQGVWFSVNRKGSGKFGTTYGTTVEKVTEVINGKRFETTKMAPLSDDQLDQAIRECPKFEKLVTVIPSRLIEQLVACDGSPAEVSAIFGLSQGREASPVPKAVEKLEKDIKAAAVDLRVAVEEPEVDADEVAALAQLEAIRAKKAAMNKPTPKVTPKVDPRDPTTSAEDFLASFGEE